MTRKQTKMLRRIVLAAILMVAAVPAAHFVPLPWVQLLFYLIPYAVIGWDILWGALRNIINGRLFDEMFLMAAATVGAFAIGEYPEAVMVMLFYQIGELFQSIAVGRSRKSIAALMDIRPDSATVLRNGKEIVVSPEEVAVGETILVRPGEKVPLDGTVLDGKTTVNNAALTGESLPLDLSVGDTVISGSVNLTGVIRVQVLKNFGESTVSKILEMVENSASKKAKAERFITRFARYYTPCVVIGALLLAVLPPLFMGNWSEWINRALIFLVVSCPCALVISVPLTFFGGIGGAGRKGILIKGANYIEALAKVKTVVFDKTGTLTCGTFNVTGVYPVHYTEQQLLELAALAESYSNHPIAESICRAYGGRLDQTRIAKAKELSGRGTCVEIDGKYVLAGNGKLMEEFGISYHEYQSHGTVVYLAVNGVYAGCIVVSDLLKNDAATAIQQLKAAGVDKTVMLTGDLDQVGQSVGSELGIDEIYTQLLPDQKVEQVERLLSTFGTVAFVGDGINDAPVLTRADVGIAMGALGSDAAIEAADVVLMDDSPVKVAVAIKLARKTMAIVKQNIIFALGVKGLVLVLGALGLAGMWIAVFADVGVMVLAILNAMRALKN